MDEFRQFIRFMPSLWQERGMVVKVQPQATAKRQLRRRSKLLAGLAAIALASTAPVTIVTVVVPHAGVTRRATLPNDLPAGETRVAETISQYTEVSPGHWVNLRDLLRTFARTPEQDPYPDPEPFI
jgi:hypothetical protein